MNGQSQHQQSSSGSNSSASAAAPQPCKNGCGFYGRQDTEWLCSKCYRDLKQQSQLQTSPEVPPSKAAKGTETSTPSSFALPSSATASAPAGAAPTISGPNTPFTPHFSMSPSGDVATPPTSGLSATAAVPDAPGRNKITTGDHTRETAPATIVEEATPTRKVQKNRKRCWECRKKVGLLGFECRCGYVYCSSHRHADQHECAFDHAKVDKEQLERQNQKVEASKMERV